MKQEKEGALIADESDVVSIYIRARERDARITPPLFPASLIIQTLYYQVTYLTVIKHKRVKFNEKSEFFPVHSLPPSIQNALSQNDMHYQP